jgi:transposase-like protein
MPSELPDKVQRWTAKRRAAVALMILKGETSSQEVARKYGLRVAEVEEWRTGS